MMKKKNIPATLSQVARAAGVGTTTVSRVINGGDLVSPDTLARVNRVIETLGYTPNQAARVLKGHRTKTIGLIIPSIADPFFSSCAEAAQAVARANDSLLIVASTGNNLDNEIENVNMLVNHRVDGLIIAAGNSRRQSLRRLLESLSMPIVAIDRPILGSDVASVVANNFVAARSAVLHLVGHGRRNIACLTGESELFTIQERIRGYRAAIKQASLPCILDTSVHDYDSAFRSITGLLASKQPPDGLFTLKNSTTICVFQVLQKLGVHMPDPIALLGFDDFELASTVRPSISVVQQAVHEIGRTAAELLFEQLFRTGHRTVTKPHTVPHLTIETELICRRSCGCLLFDFRHGLASWLVNQGTDVKTVQGLLRHSNVKTTLGLYAHQVNSSMMAAQDSMMRAMQQGSQTVN
jgi:LacI family transcriptional regulator